MQTRKAIEPHPGRLPTGEYKPGYDPEEVDKKHHTDMNRKERREYLKNGGKIEPYEGYEHDRIEVPADKYVEGVAGENVAAEIKKSKPKKGLLDKAADKLGLSHNEPSKDDKATELAAKHPKK